ncbi:FMRFamide receptor-like [Mercenaria mercenaria]|uniref:FMRFamide receptor-like n=1 Tax=Mercenaria mercenaria TaxID=6596 RepID=UPI00234F1259|nr:FMRFamide receptor-like [Mercenaria mercenaria]
MSNLTTSGYDFEDFLESINLKALNLSYDTSILLDNFQRNCSDWKVPSRNQSFSDEQIKTLDQLYYVLYFVVIPAVCVFGFFGNILNVIVFSKKKMCKTLDDIEYCTTIFLIALAISDMMFCICTFPKAFDNRTIQVYKVTNFMVYYKMYSNFAISTFILSSTLLTVLTAVMRYTAICHPFHSRQFISFRKTVGAILALFFFSVVFNLPYIWRFKMNRADCKSSTEYVHLDTGVFFTKPNFVYTHKLLWAIIGNFIPLILLLYCNIRLVKALHASQKLRLLHSRDNAGCLSAHRRINITLIAIIILFFILVAPSEISKFIYFSHSNKGAKQSYGYLLVSMITNALQCINFSVNFVLYYVIIAPFRKTIHEFVCVFMSRRGTRDSTNSPKQTCIVLTHKEQRRALI